MRVNIPITHADVVVLLILAVIFFFAIRVFVSFWRSPKKRLSQADLNDTFSAGSKVELTVDGMQCGMCEMHVKDAIRKAFPDAKMVTANHTKGVADFVVPEQISRKDLESRLHASIDPNGYRLLGVEAK